MSLKEARIAHRSMLQAEDTAYRAIKIEYEQFSHDEDSSVKTTQQGPQTYN